MRFLCAAICAAFFVVSGSAQAEHHEGHELLSLLQGGGYVLVMRHANSPSGQKASVGMSKGCDLAEGRGLDATGLYQARAMGEWMKAQEVPILKAYTSRMCRAWDTAVLAAGGAEVVKHPSQVSTDPSVVDAFKRYVAAELLEHPDANIILSSHSNIAPLYGAVKRDDEEEVVSGTIYIVSPADWKMLGRIEFHGELAQPHIMIN